MTAIANFKKRRLAERAKSGIVADVKAEVKAEVKAPNAPDNEALTLLAKLLNCEPENAIAKAHDLIVMAEIEGLDFVIGLSGEALEEIQLADEEDSEALTVTEPGNKTEQTATDLDASAANVDDAAANVSGAANAVDAAADKVNDAAGELDATANQLAGSADDIGTATAELREATAELKKPSAGRQSSRGNKTGKPAANSKKSG